MFCVSGFILSVCFVLEVWFKKKKINESIPTDNNRIVLGVSNK